MTQTQSDMNPTQTVTQTHPINQALADALADVVAYYEALAVIAADVKVTQTHRDQTAEHARQTEAAWDMAFTQGWGWDVLAGL